MMCLNNKNKTIDASIINKNAYTVQAKNLRLQVLFLFKNHYKKYIVRLLEKLITKGGKKADEKTFTPLLCFISLLIESHTVILADLVNIRLEDVAGSSRPSHSQQRESRNMKMGKEIHSLATQETASYLSIHRFDLNVKLEESL